MTACDKCLWCEQCLADEVCKHFTAMWEDESIDEMTERGRQEFYKEWLAYISQGA